MLIKKRGIFIPYETLFRIGITIVLIFAFLNIGKKIGEVAFGTNLEEKFDDFVEELNNLNEQSRQSLIFLNPSSSIIGFSQDADSFKCFGCGSEPIPSTAISSYFKKPVNEKCGDSNNKKACVCLCSKQLQIDKSKQPYEMRCSSLTCRTINKDLIDKIELKEYITKIESTTVKYPFLKAARWEGGFLYERHSRSDYVSNGLPQQQGNRFLVFLQKDDIQGKTYAAVCPHSNCMEEFKQQTQGQPTSQVAQNIPPSICQIMYSCMDSEKAKRVPPDFPTGVNKWCVYSSRIQTRYSSKDDCENVNICVNNKLNMLGQCKKDEKEGLYVLSYFS